MTNLLTGRLVTPHFLLHCGCKFGHFSRAVSACFVFFLHRSPYKRGAPSNDGVVGPVSTPAQIQDLPISGGGGGNLRKVVEKFACAER